MIISRFFAVMDDPTEEVGAIKLHAFRLFLLMHAAVRTVPANPDAAKVALSAAMMGCLVLGFVPKYAAIATRLAALGLAAKISFTFPQTSNHFYLEFASMVLLAVTSFQSKDDLRLLGSTLRWVTVIFFFYTGLQKFWYGTYFEGQFLAHMIAAEARFALMFQAVLPADELAALQAMGGEAIGSGPYRLTSPLALAMSNATWILEMVLPVFLVIGRTRAVAAGLCILFLGAVECGAREFFFGFFFVNLMLLFTTKPWNRRLLPVFGVIYAGLFVARILVASGVQLPFFN